MAVNLIPLHDRVIVKRIEEKESVQGGIIIPDSAKEKPWRAKSSPSALASARRRTDPAGRQARRSRPLRQVQRYGNQTRGRGILILREEEILAKLSGAAKAAKR